MTSLESFTVVTWRIPNTPIEIYEATAQTITDYIHNHPTLFKETYTLITCQRIIIAGLHESITSLLSLPVFNDPNASPYLEVFHGEHAFTHLTRVTAALDSLVLGEPQISGQVKQAFLQVKEQRTIPPQVELIFQYVFKTANMILSQTNIQKGKISFLSLIEDDLFAIYKTKWEHMQPPLRIGILGTGEMAEKSFKLLLKLPAPLNITFFTNRNELLDPTVTNTHKLSLLLQHPSKHPSHLPLQNIQELRFYKQNLLFEQPWNFDVLVLAIHNHHTTPFFTQTHFTRVFPTPRSHVVILDLGVPRLSDPALKTNQNITLIQVTDLIEISKTNLEKRQQAITDAETIIQQQLTNLQAKLTLLDQRMLLVHYRSYLANIGTEKKHELLMKIKPPYTPEKIDRAFDVFMNALIHHSQKELEKILLQNKKGE